MSYTVRPIDTWPGPQTTGRRHSPFRAPWNQTAALLDRELGLGGPVWHASGKAGDMFAAERLARKALRGVGDATLGEWAEMGTPGSGVLHVRRRLAAWEQHRFGIREVRDIRGTLEETWRLKSLVRDAPHLGQLLGLEPS